MKTAGLTNSNEELWIFYSSSSLFFRAYVKGYFVYLHEMPKGATKVWNTICTNNVSDILYLEDITILVVMSTYRDRSTSVGLGVQRAQTDLWHNSLLVLMSHIPLWNHWQYCLIASLHISLLVWRKGNLRAHTLKQLSEYHIVVYLHLELVKSDRHLRHYNAHNPHNAVLSFI